MALTFHLITHIFCIDPFGVNFDETFEERVLEANEYYDGIIPSSFTEQEKIVARQGYAGEWVYSYQ